MYDELPPICPKCGSTNVKFDSHREYIGGGYADSKELYLCEKCNYSWESETQSEYA